MLLDERGVIVSCEHCGQQVRLPYANVGRRATCPKCQNPLAVPNAPLHVEEAETFEALTLHAALPVLVDFWAEWCGPCKMIAPELAKVAALGAGQWLVAKVNTQRLPEVAQRMQVSSIPLLVLFRHGREVARQAGAMPAAGIEEFVRSVA